ncbi:MAG: Crp/Fnr family transcriptional regulator [Tenuifilaceae bacterium]
MEKSTIQANDLIINELPFSNLLQDSEKELFNLNSNLVEYSKRDTIIKQNSRTSHVLFIKSGLVKVSKEMRKGKSLMLKIEGPGNFIGLSSVFGSETYDYSVSAIEPTVVSFTDIKILKDVIANNGTIGLEIITQVSKNNIFNIDKLSSLLYKQLPGRIADIIIYFSENIYMNNTFTIPLTRQELAELAGTTKESLIRTLSEFKHDKIIEMDRNTISILSPKIIHTLSRLG